MALILAFRMPRPLHRIAMAVGFLAVLGSKDQKLRLAYEVLVSCHAA